MAGLRLHDVGSGNGELGHPRGNGFTTGTYRERVEGFSNQMSSGDLDRWSKVTVVSDVDAVTDGAQRALDAARPR